MSSTESPKITIPIVSPLRPSPSSILAVAVGSPTCVGRSIDFATNPFEKENKKNSREDVPSAAVVSPPTKKTKIDIIADAIAATSTSASCTSKPKEYKLDRHSCEELKMILDINSQHISGRKEELLARVIDGETYGPLLRCPICRRGRLKVRPHHQDVIFCPGYWDSYYECFEHCGYIIDAEDAPRGPSWLGPRLRYIEVPVLSPTEKIVMEYKKMGKKELSDLLIVKGQNGKGPKKHLLPRAVDAKLRGLLAQPCPDCHHGILQIQDDTTDQVVCSRSPKRCKYQAISVVDAPRSGQWDD